MTTKLFSKPQTQQVISGLRTAGYTVDKITSGYECKLDGELIFKAMVGSRGYLVRYHQDLITEAK